MKLWILFFLVTSFSNAFADCHVYIPEKTFYHASGYGINFQFTDDLALKGYLEVTDSNNADYILEIKGVEIKGRFNKAQGQIRMGQHFVSEQKTCLTQMCSINDYGKVFQRAYFSFFESLPMCKISY